MSIRMKILIPMVAVATVCAVVIGLISIYILAMTNDNFNNDMMDKASALAVELLAQHHDEATRASGMAAENEQLVISFASYSEDNRQPMINVAKSLMAATGVDFLTVMDPAGNVLVRAHEPDNFGDSLANQANIKNAMSGKQYTTTEKGTAVKLSVRCGTPIYDIDKNLIGVMSLGYRLDQSTFVDYIKRMTGTEVTVFLGDTRVSTTVLDEKGERAIDTKASEHVSEKVLAGGEYIGRANVIGRSLLTHYTPIRDVDGVILGMLFVGLDTSAADAAAVRTTWIIVAIAFVMAAISVFIALMVSSKIANPISSMAEVAKKLADGDVDVDINASAIGKDETGHLARAFSDMIKANHERAELISSIADGDLTGSIAPRTNIDVVGIALSELLRKNNQTLSDIDGAASHLDTASTQISNGAQSLAQGATEQASAVEQLSASITEVSETMQQNAKKADMSYELAKKIKSSASMGNDQMKQMLTTVKEISDSSHNIVKVIKVVEDIAFQTNILALNAAVEAARAGQYGKGFAVVAEEVRNLATKSAEAAKDTSNLIAGSVEKADQGAHIANATAVSLEEIVKGIDESSLLIEDIARSYVQQGVAIGQINGGIEQVSQIVQQNSSAAQEYAASSEEMSSQSAVLHDLISRFKLKESQISKGHIAMNALPPSTKY